jgi:hypothetical protein
VQSVGFGALTAIGFTITGNEALTTGMALGKEERQIAAAKDTQNLLRFIVNPPITMWS